MANTKRDILTGPYNIHVNGIWLMRRADTLRTGLEVLALSNWHTTLSTLWDYHGLRKVAQMKNPYFTGVSHEYNS